MVLTGFSFFSFTAHNKPFGFFCAQKLFCFFSPSQYIDFNTHGDEGARAGAWNTGSHTVVLSPLDKLGIVGGSPLSTRFVMVQLALNHAII